MKTETNNENQTSKNWMLDSINFNDDEQFQFYLDNLLFEDEDSTEQSAELPKHTTAEKNNQLPKSVEVEIENSIKKLEKRLAKERTDFQQNFSTEGLKQIKDTQAEITDLRERLKREVEMKEKYRNNYLSKTAITPKEFEQKWLESLRIQAIKDEAKERRKVHSIYKSL